MSARHSRRTFLVQLRLLLTALLVVIAAAIFLDLPTRLQRFGFDR